MKVCGLQLRSLRLRRYIVDENGQTTGETVTRSQADYSKNKNNRTHILFKNVYL